MDKLYDTLCNAWYSNTFENELENVKTMYTEKQIDSTLRKLEEQGIVKRKKLIKEKIEIRVDSKFKDCNSDNIIQNIADQFGLLIYDKKFNDSVNGCFGTAQNIVVNARNKHIILIFPECCKGENGRTIRCETFNRYYNSNMMELLKNSINHLKIVNTSVEIKYE